MPVHSRIRLWLASAAIAGICTAPVHAQYSGPSAKPQASVAGILKNPVDDQDVRLQGYLLRKEGHEKYIFSDGTGEIVAEIKDKHFASQRVDEKTKVEIVGEVDTGLRRPPEIEVDSLRLVE